MNPSLFIADATRKFWFHCVTVADSGGETPIADSCAVCRDMPESIRQRFAKGILYVRNYGDFDVPWQQVFNPWQAGDVLMLDNMPVAHGRTPFKGERRVVVAMAEPHGNLDGFPGESEE